MPANVRPRRQSSQYNCVATSVSTCLEAIGIPAAECQIDKVNAVLGAMPLRGASWEAAAGCVSHYGCRASLVIPATLNLVRSWTDAGCPVIIAYNLGNEWSHAVTVYDVSDEFVMIADSNCPDPNQMTKKMTHDEFYAVWWEKSATGYKIRRPAMKIEREITPDGRQVIASISPNRINKSATMSTDTTTASTEVLAIKINERDKRIKINPDDVNRRNETHRESLINPATGAQRSWGSGKHQNPAYDNAKGRQRREKHPQRNQDREASAQDTTEASGRILTALWGMPDMRSWFETDSEEAERIYAPEIKLTQAFMSVVSQLPRTSHAVQNLIDLHIQTENTGMEQPVLRRSLVMNVLHDIQKLANSYLSQFSPETRGKKDAPHGIQHLLESVEKIAPSCAMGRIGIPMFLKMLGINQSVFGV